MDRHLAKRLLLSLGITGIASALVAIANVLAGSTLIATSALWPIPVGLFPIVFLVVEFLGALRSPREKYDQTLEDDWDR